MIHQSVGIFGDPHFSADVTRVVLSAGGLLLSVLMFRLAWLRVWKIRRGIQSEQPHPATYVSFGLCLLLVAADRIEFIGLPFNWWRFIASVAVLVLAAWGLSRRYTLDLRRSRKEADK